MSADSIGRKDQGYTNVNPRTLKSTGMRHPIVLPCLAARLTQPDRFSARPIHSATRPLQTIPLTMQIV